MRKNEQSPMNHVKAIKITPEIMSDFYNQPPSRDDLSREVEKTNRDAMRALITRQAYIQTGEIKIADKAGLADAFALGAMHGLVLAARQANNNDLEELVRAPTCDVDVDEDQQP
jgi:hypothetical protein